MGRISTWRHNLTIVAENSKIRNNTQEEKISTLFLNFILSFEAASKRMSQSRRANPANSLIFVSYK